MDRALFQISSKSSKPGSKISSCGSFFTTENIQRFIKSEEDSAGKVISFAPILDAVDYDKIFQSFIDAINASSLGSMLAMVGGAEALEPLREPVSEKMRASLKDMTESESFQKALHASLNTQKLSDDITDNIESIVDARLDELTPQNG